MPRAVRLKPRIATERSDAGEPRIVKIIDLIRSSRYSVHDLCRCQAGEKGEYLRKVRNWLAELPGIEGIGGARVLADYEEFQRWQLQRQRHRGFSDDDIRDYSTAELLGAMFDWRELRHEAS